MPPKQPNMPGFGETLRSMRKKFGMTMADMAEDLCVSLVLVSDIERGRGGSRSLAGAYVQALRERGLDPKTALILDACAATVPWSSPPSGDTTEGDAKR